MLREVTKRVANTGNTRTTSHDTLLYEDRKPFYAGQSKSFEVEVHIPATLVGYTAVGNIISRAYYLCLMAEVNACYSNPTLMIQTTFVSTFEPELTEAEVMQPPEGWNPQVAPMKVIPQIPAYQYQP